MHPTLRGFIPTEFVRIFTEHRRRFFISAGLVAGLVALYALTRSNTWEAVQTMIVRNEATPGSTQERLGKFDRPDQMQNLQETILELARSRGVLEETLRTVGGPSGQYVAGAPSERAVEKLRSAVRLTPPKGAEFGKTEIFYLNVRDADHDRAIQLATALSQQLQLHYQQILDEKAKSMIKELARTVTVASDDLKTSTARLSKVETAVGTDLAELRILEKSPSGGSDLRTQRTSLETELRDARTALRSNQALRELLVASTKDTGQLLATPNRLLESQPALRRLKDGLIDAQLRTCQLRGYLTDDHPQVHAALAAEEDIRHSLANELSAAIRGVDVDLRLTNIRVNSLTAQLENVHDRLDKLASVRAQYGNLSEEIQHRQQILRTAEVNLADARGSEAAARSANLISLIDLPDTGSSPVGPGRMMILLCGVVGGLAVGFGVVLLTTGPEKSDEMVAGTIRPVSVQRTSQLVGLGVSLKEALTRLGHRRSSWN